MTDLRRLPPYQISEDGRHSFATGVGEERVLIGLPLTGRQVAFLIGNQAAARCCLVKGWITTGWIDQLIAATEAEPAGAKH